MEAEESRRLSSASWGARKASVVAQSRSEGLRTREGHWCRSQSLQTREPGALRSKSRKRRTLQLRKRENVPSLHLWSTQVLSKFGDPGSPWPRVHLHSVY